MSSYDNADCHYGDHHWVGGACTRCYKRFRCACGRFMRIEEVERHVEEGHCPSVPALAAEGGR